MQNQTQPIFMEYFVNIKYLAHSFSGKIRLRQWIALFHVGPADSLQCLYSLFRFDFQLVLII